VTIPAGKKVGLKISSEAVADLSPLALLKPDDLQVIDSFYNYMTDAHLAFFQKLSGLQSLNLSMNRLNGVGLAYLQGMTSLEVLDLSIIFELEAQHLIYLQALTSLRWLNLFLAPIGKKEIVYLKRLTSLEHLIISPISDDCLEDLRRALPRCDIYIEG
jgi:hypothetical protein